MKSYELRPEEFAEVFAFLSRANDLFHAKRSESEFKAFQKRYYPTIYNIYYKILSKKMDDEKFEMLSNVPPAIEDGPIENYVKYISEHVMSK